MQENCVDIISGVPEPIALIIFDFLDVQDLTKCEKCCKNWSNLARDNLLWKRKCGQNNFREIQESERNENYVKFCTRFSPHWKGVFVYHHNLRKNWLGKTICVNLNDPKKQKQVFYFHHIDEKILVTQFSDFSIRIFNSSTRKVSKILRGHTHYVNQVKMCGNVLVSSSMDSTLKAWNIDKEMCVHSKWLDYDSIKFALGNDRIASTNNGQKIQLWRPETGEVIFEVDNRHRISCMVIHDSFIFTGCVNGAIRTFSLSDGTLKNFVQIHSGEIKQIMVKGLLSISMFKNVCLKIWNTADGLLLHTDQPRNNILPISLDGDRIAWASSKCSVKIWDITRGKTVRILGHDKAIVAITSNEDYLFCVDDNNLVVMWDLNTGEFKRVFEIYPNRKVLSVHFFSVTKTKMVLHTVGFNGKEETVSTKKFFADFDVI